MVKIFLFGDDLELLNLWEKNLNKYNVDILYDIEEILELSNSIIVLNLSSIDFNSNDIIKRLKNNSNKILLLDRIPRLEKAKNFFSIGVNGYGNAIMSSLFLCSAIEAIESELLWIMPDLSSQMIMEIADCNQGHETKNEIFDLLTSKESQIVCLMAQGLSNTDISSKLDISINTVKTHIKHIYEKLQVKDKLSLALLLKK